MLGEISENTVRECFALYRSGRAKNAACFDFEFRKNQKLPIVFSGLNDIIDAVLNLKFDCSDIEVLKSKGIGDDDFYVYLLKLRFSGDILSVPEGSTVFDGEPVLCIAASEIECLLVGDIIKKISASRSSYSTCAARLCFAAGGANVFGDITDEKKARAVRLGGVHGINGDNFHNIMSHSFVGMYENEYSAFRAYLKAFPENAVLAVDTYDTVNSGLVSAIEAMRDTQGVRACAVRLDSGDIVELSKRVRKMLDAAGLCDCLIWVSGELCGEKIAAYNKSGAPVDAFLVDVRCFAPNLLSGNFSLAAEENNGVFLPKIKIGENYSKITLPGVKKLLRYYDKSGMAIADEVLLYDEPVPRERHTLFHPEDTWKTKTLYNYTHRELLEQIFKSGELVYSAPSEVDAYAYAKREAASFASEYMSGVLEYPVDYSEGLWTQRRRMLGRHRSAFFLR